ncbi:CsiV family protein [Aliikangiella sp. IMCC44653]
MHFRILISLAVISLIGSHIPAIAAEEEAQRWFEIEVIVYKRTSDEGLFEESWDDQVEFSLAPNAVDFLQPYHIVEPEIDSSLTFGSLTKDNTTETTTNAFGIELAPSEEIKSPPSPTQPLGQTEQSEPLVDTEQAQIQVEQPYQLLATELRSLNNEATSLGRHPEYRVLAHYAWRQPVVGSREALPIRIAGGQDFSENFTYQGAKIESEALNLNSLNTSFRESQNNTFAILNSTSASNSANINTEARTDNSSQTLNNIHSSEIDSPTQPISDQVISDSQTTASHKNISLDGTTATDNIFQQILDKENQIISDVAVAELTPEMRSKLQPKTWVPELDGDITIYVNRYLHIKTNLFLRRPDKEAVEIFELEPILAGESNNLIPTSSYLQQDSQQSEQGGNQHINQLSADNRFKLPQDNQTNDLSAANLTNNHQSQLVWDIGENFLESESEKRYIERLFNYPIQQSRRVRSGELHFFDHPLMGVLVLITPYELPSFDKDTAGEIAPPAR